MLIDDFCSLDLLTYILSDTINYISDIGKLGAPEYFHYPILPFCNQLYALNIIFWYNGTGLCIFLVHPLFFFICLPWLMSLSSFFFMSSNVCLPLLFFHYFCPSNHMFDFLSSLHLFFTTSELNAKAFINVFLSVRLLGAR